MDRQSQTLRIRGQRKIGGREKKTWRIQKVNFSTQHNHFSPNIHSSLKYPSKKYVYKENKFYGLKMKQVLFCPSINISLKSPCKKKINKFYVWKIKKLIFCPSQLFPPCIYTTF
jgi:hypothetical protein